MNVLEEAKNKMAQVMTKYRYKIEDIEREEYEEIEDESIKIDGTDDIMYIAPGKYISLKR